VAKLEKCLIVESDQTPLSCKEFFYLVCRLAIYSESLARLPAIKPISPTAIICTMIVVLIGMAKEIGG
jgi:hypothetical protein